MESARKLDISQWVSVISALIGIVAAPLVLFNFVSESVGGVFAAGFCIMYAVAWYLLLREKNRQHHDAKYAESLESLHKCLHYIRDAWYAYQVTNSDHIVVSDIKRSLAEFATAFGIITGTKCRTCIKVVYVADPEAKSDRPKDAPARSLAVKTFCRSEDAQEPTHNSKIDWVDDNSDFEELMKADTEPDTRRFLRNELPYPGYKNSHYTEEQLADGRMLYASTIVWPIRKKLESEEEDDLLGFLCVDSKGTGVFHERYDVEIGAGYADALYCLLRTILDRHQSVTIPAEQKKGEPHESI